MVKPRIVFSVPIIFLSKGVPLKISLIIKSNNDLVILSSFILRSSKITPFSNSISSTS